MSDGPKLYTTKPRKAQLKPKTEEGRPFSQSPMDPTKPSATPPPPPPKESFVRRSKFFWPILFTVNLAIGAYLYLNANKKEEGAVIEVVDEPPASAISTSATAVPEKALSQPTVIPPIPREPIPEDEQRKLFKWMLEEKRRVKAANADEKKRIDEERAILKQFIRAKSIPTI